MGDKTRAEGSRTQGSVNSALINYAGLVFFTLALPIDLCYPLGIE